jgi:hypothetical protein
MINPRGLIVLLFAVAILLTVCVRARADDKPPLDCTTVRAYVAQHGIVVAYARALAAGYSPRQIRDVRRRCNV